MIRILFLLVQCAYSGSLLYPKKVLLPRTTELTGVIYGSPKQGYFESANFKITGKGVEFTFLPPTYQEALTFYAKQKELHCLARRSFSNPTPVEHQLKNVKITGSLRTPFFLTNGYTPFLPADEPSPKGHSVVFLLNKLGEVVWSFKPDLQLSSADHRTRTVLAKTLTEDEIGLLHPYDRSSFQKVDWFGKRTLLFIPKGEVLHHDFLLSNADELLTLSHSEKTIRKPWFFWRKPLVFLGSPLLAVNTKNASAKNLWDYLENHNPFRERDWTWNDVDSKGEENNFTHANSITENNTGYLLSLRSLNKLVFLDKKTLEPLWTMGPSPDNTFALKGTSLEFYRQHHATLLPDNSLLLFDNGKKTSRILKIHFSKITDKPELAREWYPSPAIHSTRHGSAFLIENDHIVGFFPNTTPGSDAPNRIVEFDSKKETGRLEFAFGYSSAGYRAEPVTSILGSRPYLGTVPPCNVN